MTDVMDLEKIFYDIVRNNSPSEMYFEDFIEGLRAISRKLARALIKDSSESLQMLLANEDLLYNRFLKEVLLPIYEDNKDKELKRKFECQMV
jgi:hypothetical protein